LFLLMTLGQQTGCVEYFKAVAMEIAEVQPAIS
jgi:hypothetical protein